MTTWKGKRMWPTLGSIHHWPCLAELFSRNIENIEMHYYLISRPRKANLYGTYIHNSISCVQMMVHHLYNDTGRPVDYAPGRRNIVTLCLDTISYPLFASADTGFYPHAASQYYARPKSKRGIAMLYISLWWRQTWYTPLYFTVVNQSEARISTEHGIRLDIDRFYPYSLALGQSW